MKRKHGWSVLAITALELIALALVSRLSAREAPLILQSSTVESDVIEPEVIEPEVIEPEVIEAEIIEPEVIEPAIASDNAQEFLTENAGENTGYYRAGDASGEVLVAFYADGRIRIADEEHRLAGILQNGRADVIRLADNTWSEVFVREAPDGRVQLHLRGGPFDGRVLTCSPAEAAVQ